MKIHLPLKVKKDLSYQIQIGNNIFKDLRKIVLSKFNPDKAIIITDENVFNLYEQKIENELIGNSSKFEIIVIAAGEESKSQQTRDELENKIIDLKPTRSSMIIAIGGGVVGDISGFLASVILRGIRYIQVPTTIIAQVDSSIGGKTGINTKHSKNLIGTFHQPSFILVDFDFLSTLPYEEYLSGLAEIVKSLLIASKSGFEYLEKFSEKILNREEIYLQKLIKESIRTKAQIVAKDPEEKNLRKVLNFGHTIGHAIEALSNYKIKHGFAIAEGILVESYLSFITNKLSEVDLFRIQYIVNRLTLDKNLRKEFSFNDIYEKMTYDKKKTGDQINFSLLREIGKCEINKTVSKELIEIAYNH
ncbi:MAG: 3-dehydroquinate synthase [Ignavibacteria bacterium]|nr:3-dehydroquinate synthase [Ignavibacteria bacterium]